MKLLADCLEQRNSSINVSYYNFMSKTVSYLFKGWNKISFTFPHTHLIPGFNWIGNFEAFNTHTMATLIPNKILLLNYLEGE